MTAAILDRMEADGTDHVCLDLPPIEPERFPNLFATCREAGLDPEREPVPVAPAAHYLMGGVVCDLDGRTTLPGLYAVGECACTGLHGANRLASNSLSECFVFGARAAGRGAAARRAGGSVALPEWRFEPPSRRDPRGRLARTPARGATRHGLEALARRSLSARADDRPRRRSSARVARRRTGEPTIPLRDPALDGVHLVVGPGGALRSERWT